MPDDELLKLAEKKELTKDLDAQVKRMLKDEKARALTDNFAMQWLQLRRLKTHSPDDKLFPEFTERLRSSMLKETELFLAEIIREDRSILDMIDARYTYLDYELAWHYGIVDTVGNRRGQKPVRTGGERIGGGRRRGGSPVVPGQLPQGDGRGGPPAQASGLARPADPPATPAGDAGRGGRGAALG